MKKLLVLLTFLGIGMFTSCSKDSTTAAPTADALTITADALTHNEGESFKFTVKSSDGTDVSSKATIQAPVGLTGSGNSFYSLTAGTYTVTATYNGVTTKPLQVTVTANSMTSTTVTPSSTDVVTGDVITFTVAGDNKSNVTQACTLYVSVNGADPVAISGNTYTATTAGTVTVTATYPSSTPITSSTLTLNVGQAINFTKRVLVEDFTGTWCGWCPRVVWALGLVEQQTKMIVPVAMHIGPSTSEPDPFNTGAALSLAQGLGINSFPTAKLNRSTTWTADEPTNVQQVVDLVNKGTNPRVGLAMTTSLNGNTATVALKVKFGQDFSNLKVVVYALEDGLTGTQTNYTTYYNGSQLSNFQYDDVFRGVLTGSTLGDAITGSTSLGTEFTNTYTYTVPSTVNAANLHFVAFVLDSTKTALNVRNAGTAETQDYEIQ